MADTARDLAAALAASEYAVVLTGAGISTESGIPDFRSAGGLWERYDPMEVASLSTFLSEPERFWGFHRPRIDLLSGVEPNPAHLAVAELERRGIVRAVVTQNIDRLHARAGSDPIEVHGALDRGLCLRCGARVSIDELVARADAAGDGVPRCGCGFPMKSGVVLFGEPLPAAAIEAAYEHAGRADLMLVIGSSLLVAPGEPAAADRPRQRRLAGDPHRERDALRRRRARAAARQGRGADAGGPGGAGRDGRRGGLIRSGTRAARRPGPG